MRARPGPRPLGAALDGVRRSTGPRTLLGAVQGAWAGAVGEAVAAQATPVSERDGVVTVACRSSTWAQELDLLQDDLIEALREALRNGEEPERRDALRALRFSSRPPEHF